MSAIAVTRRGRGPELICIHGGAGPRRTWAGIESLEARWTLAFVFRRGYPPSPPRDGAGADFEADADDLLPLLDARPHIVAHSYGTLGALIAAARRPSQVRSLTLIEPPLYHLAARDPDVARLRRAGDAVLRDGLDADPGLIREFLRITGTEDPGDGPLSDPLVRAVRRAHGTRSPSDARPRLDVLRRAGVPTLTCSGDHHAGMERICDAAARRLAGERAILPGAGHFVTSAPEFTGAFGDFLTRVQTTR